MPLARSRTFESIHLIWRFRLRSPSFTTIFENGNYFPTHATREFVRFVNYIENGIEVSHGFANDRGPSGLLSEFVVKRINL